VHALLNDLNLIFEGAPTPKTLLTHHSSSSEIKRAYMQAIRAVHPDKVGVDASIKVKLISQAVFGALNVAYEKKKKLEGW
jgi:hypothetical protein